MAQCPTEFFQCFLSECSFLELAEQAGTGPQAPTVEILVTWTDSPVARTLLASLSKGSNVFSLCVPQVPLRCSNGGDNVSSTPRELYQIPLLLLHDDEKFCYHQWCGCQHGKVHVFSFPWYIGREKSLSRRGEFQKPSKV